MQLPTIITAAVEGAAFHFDKPYSYLWQDADVAPQPGLRVLVPFGGGNRRRQAVVLDVQKEQPVPKLKPVAAVLDEEPLFTLEMIELARWLKEHTFCTLFEALKTQLPPGLTMRVTPLYKVADDLPEETVAALDEEERRLFDEVASFEDGIERGALFRALGYTETCTLPEKLIKKGVLTVDASAKRVAADATVRFLRLAVTGDELEARLAEHPPTPKQKALLDFLSEVGCSTLKELQYFAVCSTAVANALVKKGLVEYFERERLRSPIKPEERKRETPAVLNDEQQAAFEGLSALSKEGKPAAALLYGVTGSGKTQVYMRLIEDVLSRGKQALVLVPEISLTPQVVTGFVNRFGRDVAVLHSGLSVGERMDEWKRIRRGDAKIVVGTRSAIFAPLPDLGLIVFDEEQEHTYKSETSPRYHARDVAKYRVTKENALLLLASATPSVDTYRRALDGKIHLFTLTSRFGDAALPTVKVADMRADESGHVIGDALKAEMETCLAAGKQVILLLNRRGYNTFVSCRNCGHVLTCPSCSVSMTYHRANAQLMCHVCGYHRPCVTACPECGEETLRYAGLGTQKVENELAELFPDVPVLRMDADTTMSRFAYEEKFQAFADGEYKIMIGTQMVAKGLDFPDVALVGVLSADQALYGDDFRAYETAFSLLTQVIGRAGRRDADSLAVVQTVTPENPIIALAAAQNYPAFYESEIEARSRMKYPPFTDLFQIGFVGEREQAVKTAAETFLAMLRQAATTTYQDVPLIVLDPTRATVARAAGKYRYRLLVKGLSRPRTRQMMAELLTAFGKDAKNKTVTAFIDVNPASML